MPNVFETTDAAAGTSTAYSIGIGQTAQGLININGDQDWWRVDLVAGRTYTFAMTGTGTNNVRDTLLSLRSADGTTTLATNDNGLAGNNSVITFTATTTGSFYLVASAASSTEGGRQYGLSVTEGTRASFDSEMAAGVMDADIAWNSVPGTSATVTYAFRLTDSGDEAGFQQLSAAQISAVQSILATFSEVCGLTFTQVNPGGYSDNATILFSNYNDPNDGAGAYAYYPGSTAATSRAGDVYLNTSSVSMTSLPVGSFSYFAIMHELGHALGLSHPGLYNAAPGVSITYAANAQFTQDTQMYSVMSYFDESNTGASSYASYADTLMLNDILALQNIYGANTSTRSGHTVYGYNSNAGATYDFTANATPAFSIWDGGGIDTIDLSLATTAQSLNLNAGSFSSVKTGTFNMSIAVGVVIENAIGGSANDFIVANAAANVINGGAGSDWVSYRTSTSGVTVNFVLGTVSDSGATDTLISVENAVGSAFDDTFIGVQSIVAQRFNGGTAGIDTLSYEYNTQYVFINLYDSLVGKVFGTDYVASIENAVATAYNDFLLGSDGDNVLDGGTGGADYFDGFGGIDTLSFARNGRGAVIDLTYGFANDGESVDTFQRMENVIGSSFNDRIFNSVVANVLTGNGGNDIFHFNSFRTQGDAIMDFNAGDFIYFTGYGAGSVTHLGGGLWSVASANNSIVETFTLTGVTNLSGQFAFI